MYNGGIDFRKQINGLIHLVQDEMQSPPNDGSLYVFRNRGRDKLKVLMWDRNGFVLGYKRLEKGRFDFPETGELKVSMTMDQLMMLVSGMPMVYVGNKPEKMMMFS